MDGSKASQRVRSALSALLAVVGPIAVVAGLLLILAPDGHLLRLPTDDLKGSPFPNYLVPGLALAGLGALHSWAFYLQVARHPRAWFWSGMSGAGLCVWIAVQVLIIQPSFLQPALFLVGAAQGVLALVQWRQERAAPAPAPPG